MNSVIDTNIFLYGVDNLSPHHKKSKKFINEYFLKNNNLCICWSIVYEFLRVSTHPKIFTPPLKHSEAIHFIEIIVQHPQTKIIQESENHLDIYQEITSKMDISGNFIHDCHIAAIMKENNIQTIYTHDKGFKKFPFLEVINPLE